MLNYAIALDIAKSWKSWRLFLLLLVTLIATDISTKYPDELPKMLDRCLNQFDAPFTVEKIV